MASSAPVTVSIVATPSALTEVEQTVLTLTIMLSEAPLEGGLNVAIDSETSNALDQFDLSAAVYNGATLALVNADASGLTLNISEATATAMLPIAVDDIAEAAETIAFALVANAAYNIDAGASTFSVTIADRPPDFLTVGLTAAPVELVETEETALTLTVMLSEAPPANGIDVTIDSKLPDTLGEFDLLAAMFSGATLVETQADSSGFTLNVTEQTASVTLPVVNDGVAEGDETVTFGLASSTMYDIDPGASEVSVTIFDLSPDILTVGITADPTELIETEMTVLTLTITLSQDPPAEGLNVTIDSDIPGSLAEFDVFAAVFEGAVLVLANADSSGFTLNVFESVATVTLPVFNDNAAEGPEILTFTLVPSEAYAIDPSAGELSVTILDTAL